MKRLSTNSFPEPRQGAMSRRPPRFVSASLKLFLITCLLLPLANSASTTTQKKSATRNPQAAIRKPLLVAHRGASGYAPEHTLAAYELAIDQGADFVEQDLQITRDGVLVCLHDAELSRTTNVKEVYPDRATLRDVTGQGTPKRGWYAGDFTLAELKKLDAGSWFFQANSFIDQGMHPLIAAAMGRSKSELAHTIPTLQEAIKLVNNRAGLYIEMKDSEFYKTLGFDMAEKLAALLKAQGYAGARKSKRVFIQSFSKENLLRMRQLAPQYARVQLLPMEDPKRKDTSKVTPELAREIAEYAQGAGPSKTMLTSAREVETFHAAGLVIHPYTFRGPTTALQRRSQEEKLPDGSTVRENIIADIQRFLAYGIDGGFTDYPALWKEALRRQPPR
jgi:glycerophosphoryl diester phosphodiesterase